VLALKSGLYFERKIFMALTLLVASLTFVFALIASAQAFAAPEHSSAIAYKLTLGTYTTSGVGSSDDFNIRAQVPSQSAFLQGQHTAWFGWFHTSKGFSQTRLGYEFLLNHEALRPTFSIQWAHGGYWGGSVTGEVGPKNLFAIAGVGRTNLQTYYNINFDPNDMIQYGLGWRPELATSDQTVMLYRIQDNRLNTGQAVTHLTWRDTYGAGHRLSADLFFKRGEIDTGLLIRHKVGLGLGYDAEPWFVKVAVDPNVNFTAGRMLRLSFGRRF
jgi:hypothetical protein